MADNIMYMLLGAVGLLALLAFMQRSSGSTAIVAPPPYEVQRKIWEQIEAPQEQMPVPTTPGQATNACGSTRYAYPNFAGTPREGQKCIDSLDCQNHPPVGFPSYQECCPEDGTCFQR